MKRRESKKIEGVSYWQSYSDMMAALLLMFVLIMAFTLLQDKKHTQEMTEKMHKAQIEAEEQQERYLQLQKKAEEQQEQIEQLIGVKENIIKALSKEFDTLKVDPNTGAITFESSVLFDYNKFNLKREAKEKLNDFFPQYFRVLMNDEFEPYVSEIIIEGYTDDLGDYIYNLDLSQKRAFSIAEYCLDERNGLLNSDELTKLRVLLTANGRSMNELIITDGEIDRDASRRVEFKFRLKDDEMITKMQEILEK